MVPNPILMQRKSCLAEIRICAVSCCEIGATLQPTKVSIRDTSGGPYRATSAEAFGAVMTTHMGLAGSYSYPLVVLSIFTAAHAAFDITGRGTTSRGDA